MLLQEIKTWDEHERIPNTQMLTFRLGELKLVAYFSKIARSVLLPSRSLGSNRGPLVEMNHPDASSVSTALSGYRAASRRNLLRLLYAIMQP